MRWAQLYLARMEGRDCGSVKYFFQASQEPLSKASLFTHSSFTSSISKWEEKDKEKESHGRLCSKLTGDGKHLPGWKFPSENLQCSHLFQRRHGADSEHCWVPAGQGRRGPMCSATKSSTFSWAILLSNILYLSYLQITKCPRNGHASTPQQSLQHSCSMWIHCQIMAPDCCLGNHGHSAHGTGMTDVVELPALLTEVISTL